MSYIILPSRRTRQPQGAVRVNWSSPLARGLVYALHEPTGQDYVSGRTYTKNDLTRKLSASTYGLEYSPAYTDALGIQFESAPVSAPPFTLYCEVDPASGLATQGFGMPISIQTATDRYYRIVLNGSSGAILFQAYNGTTQAAPSSSSFSYAGGWYSVAAVAESTSLWRSYTNGVAGTDVTTTVSGVNPTRTTVGFYNGGGPSSYMDGGLRNVKIWNRALSQVEIVENRLYPFAFLIENPRRIYFGAGATGGGAYEIDAQPGGYAVNGTAATLARGLFVNAQPGAYAVNGTAATLARGYYIDAQPGTYAVNGTAATLARGLVVNAGPGALTLTGTDATLEKVTPGVYTIDAQPGSFALTGIDATLTYTPLNAYTLDAQPATFTISGTAATLVYAGSSIWTDISVSATTWGDVGGATSIWTDL